MAEEVWALAEIVEYLGVSQQRALVLSNRPDFPEPIAQLRVGRIWRAEDVRAWAQRWRERYPRLPDDNDEL